MCQVIYSRRQLPETARVLTRDTRGRWTNKPSHRQTRVSGLLATSMPQIVVTCSTYVPPCVDSMPEVLSFDSPERKIACNCSAISFTACRHHFIKKSSTCAGAPPARRARQGSCLKGCPCNGCSHPVEQPCSSASVTSSVPSIHFRKLRQASLALISGINIHNFCDRVPFLLLRFHQSDHPVEAMHVSRQIRKSLWTTT